MSALIKTFITRSPCRFAAPRSSCAEILSVISCFVVVFIVVDFHGDS